MPRPDGPLWRRIARSGNLFNRHLVAADRQIALGELVGGSNLECARDELAGRSVLVATQEQLATAAVLIGLDGTARRLVLCPPHLPAAAISAIVEMAEIEAVVSDGSLAEAATPAGVRLVPCAPAMRPADIAGHAARSTEWVLMTSGTTGVPKLAVHALSSLAAPIGIHPPRAAAAVVWSTFYDIRRYGGLQILLRALLGGGSLVLSSPDEATADFLARAGHASVTHISGTPSHWRRALMSGAADRIMPRYVRLSGEIADQPIIDDLRACYAWARVGHAFASTEAGVAFEVEDGLAGFPARLVGQRGGAVEIKIVDGSLRIRSDRTASHYLGGAPGLLRDRDGFVDTGDMLEHRADRYHFIGRRGGIINVGGLKVHPEEVEAAINRHPAVQMALVRARKNPFTGDVVVAEIVLRPGRAAAAIAPAELARDIIETCRRALPPHKVPAAVRIVPALDVAAAGKLARRNA